MAVIRCLKCGEIAESHWVDCPGCGVILPNPQMDSRPASPSNQEQGIPAFLQSSADRSEPRGVTIPLTQQEARSDISTSSVLSCLLGLMIMVPGASILSDLLRIPWNWSCLIVFFSLLTAAFTFRPKQQSGSDFVGSASVSILKVLVVGAGVMGFLAVGAFVLVFVLCFASART
jgi:hypothetical protein